ncbi:histone-like nucleoid-structuring protein Lsr2 [Actinocrispum wychmicini]|uniref:Lsr2 protein n=1 Tax=Actinocrispum wychmicini TaxID=1213861 RepID=A0A4R2JRG6_9PSEU|nr:Lsr2 protein [Actinocrispum wychmicini]
MATRIVLVDDLDGNSEADETLSFALDGQNFEIDLTAGNAAQLRAFLGDFVAAARRAGTNGAVKVGAKRPADKPGTASGYGKETLKQIREWAKANGMEVSDRGRVSGLAITAWEQSRLPTSPAAKAVDTPKPDASAVTATTARKTAAASIRPATAQATSSSAAAKPASSKTPAAPARRAVAKKAPSFSARAK